MGFTWLRIVCYDSGDVPNRGSREEGNPSFAYVKAIYIKSTRLKSVVDETRFALIFWDWTDSRISESVAAIFERGSQHASLRAMVVHLMVVVCNSGLYMNMRMFEYMNIRMYACVTPHEGNVRLTPHEGNVRQNPHEGIVQGHEGNVRLTPTREFGSVILETEETEMKTEILVDADIVIRIRETGEEQHLTAEGIPCTWVWEDGSRDAIEYWAVADWITDTFGNNIDWFSIKCWTGTPEESK